MPQARFAQDVIVAPATPPGLSAIAIIRLSGLDCITLVQKVFAGKVLTARSVRGRVGAASGAALGAAIRFDGDGRRRPVARMAAPRGRCSKALRLRVPVVRAGCVDGRFVCLVPTRPTPAPAQRLKRFRR